MSLAGTRRGLPESDPILHVMRIRLELLQAILLTAGPVGNVVHSTVHTCVVIPQQAEACRLRPNVALTRTMEYFTRVAVAGSVNRSLDFGPLVTVAAITAADCFRRCFYLLLELCQQFCQFCPSLLDLC